MIREGRWKYPDLFELKKWGQVRFVFTLLKKPACKARRFQISVDDPKKLSSLLDVGCLFAFRTLGYVEFHFLAFL